MRIRLPMLAISLSVMIACVHAADDTTIIAGVLARFRPVKPAVIMNYDVTYTLLHVRLKRVAGATIKATEGAWRDKAGAWMPAYLIDFHVASPGAGAGLALGNISLFKRTVSVLTMPALKIITYAKQNDEFIKPFLGQGRRNKYLEIYDFESGALTYRHHDLVSGAVTTNLPGMADLARQSMEVADVLQTLYAAYRGNPAKGRAVANKVHFNVDGVVRTFELAMKKGQTSAPVFSGKHSALYADVQPREARDSRNESFSMWCMPFREFAGETRDPALKQLAETSLECAMLPLSGEYSLFLGALQCTLTNVWTPRPH